MDIKRKHRKTMHDYIDDTLRNTYDEYSYCDYCDRRGAYKVLGEHVCRYCMEEQGIIKNNYEIDNDIYDEV
jgi:hypothetical protein